MKIVAVHKLTRQDLLRLADIRLKAGFKKYGPRNYERDNMLLDGIEEALDWFNHLELQKRKLSVLGIHAEDLIRNLQEEILRQIDDVRCLSLASPESTYRDSRVEKRVGWKEVLSKCVTSGE